MSLAMTVPVPSKSTTSLIDHFRCSDLPAFGVKGDLGQANGFFRFGPNVVCYGQSSGVVRTKVNGNLVDASMGVHSNGQGLLLPFDASQVLDNLRYESYVRCSNRVLEKPWVRDIYYKLRPLLTVSIRKHLQGLYLKGWERIEFPCWPVDRNVDLLLEKLLQVGRGIRHDPHPGSVVCRCAFQWRCGMRARHPPAPTARTAEWCGFGRGP